MSVARDPKLLRVRSRNLRQEIDRLPTFYDNDRAQFLGITLDQHARILDILEAMEKVDD